MWMRLRIGKKKFSILCLNKIYTHKMHWTEMHISMNFHKLNTLCNQIKNQSIFSPDSSLILPSIHPLLKYLPSCLLITKVHFASFCTFNKWNHVFLCVWFVLPSIVRIIHGVVCSNSSFFLFSLECSVVWLYHSLFTVNGHLVVSSLELLWRALCDISVHVLWWT